MNLGEMIIFYGTTIGFVFGLIMCWIVHKGCKKVVLPTLEDMR